MDRAAFISEFARTGRVSPEMIRDYMKQSLTDIMSLIQEDLIDDYDVEIIIYKLEEEDGDSISNSS